jgi:hypothetical protein
MNQTDAPDDRQRNTAGLDNEIHVSPSRLASYWGVHVDTIYRDIRKGVLAATESQDGQLIIAVSDAYNYGAPVQPCQPLPTPKQEWQRAEIVSAHERNGGRCAICGEAVDLSLTSGRHQATLDHIFPQSRGGTHERENLQLAHRQCNSRKGDRLT